MSSADFAHRGVKVKGLFKVLGVFFFFLEDRSSFLCANSVDQDQLASVLFVIKYVI